MMSTTDPRIPQRDVVQVVPAERLADGTTLAPPAAAPVAQQVAETRIVEGVPIATTRVRTDRVSWFAPDAVLAGIVGLALLVLGLVAITRAGLESPLSEPVVSVGGFTHTALLGAVEALFGVALLGAGAARSRSGEIFFGLLLAVVGFVAAIQTSSFAARFAVESSLAWLAVVAGAVVALCALVLPRTRRSSIALDRR